MMNARPANSRCIWKTVVWTAAAAFAAVAAAAPAHAAVANFDNLKEGFHGTELTTGGIRFFDMDDGLGSSTIGIEQANASGSLGGKPGFTSPNALTGSGYTPGSGGGYHSFQSMRFELAPGSGTTMTAAASIEVYTGNLASGNLLTLDALYHGTFVTLVDSDSYTIPNTFGAHHHLSVSGAFDQLYLHASGPSANGRAFTLFDTVRITPVPEPASLGLLAMGGGGLLLLRRRRKARA